MASITFDTLELVENLKKSGLSAEQSEAIVKNIAKSQEGLLSKAHFEHRVEKLEDRLNYKINLIQWMLAIVIVVTVIPALTKLFSV
ncbi:MAG: hypothetical protein RBS36_06510 [Thiomicrospira sp.]|jgi:hypothetical protein|nr:hypothetical protein [Thiomicrospira sp.]